MKIIVIRTILLLLLMSFGLSPLQTQAQNRYIIKKRTPRTSSSSQPKKSDTEILAKKITAGHSTKSDKANAIYHWIATNISYDNELRLNKKLQKEIYISESNVIAEVLKRKKALCGGYAFLFEKLCNDVGIEAKVIHGFTKKYHSGSANGKNPDHTWNAVKIDGQWQLLDITWAVSHGSRSKPKSFWYNTKPSDFIKTHYPEDKRWTLLANSPSLSEFLSIKTGAK